jgi:hypothetical protein
MDRRTLLKSTLSTTLSAGLLAAAADEAIGAQPAPARAMSDVGDFIEAAPGVKLAFTDWGAGKPVVFIHGASIGDVGLSNQRALRGPALHRV